MADLALILGAAAFVKQVIPVGMELYNLVKSYGSNFPPNMSRSDALKTLRNLIAKLRQQHEHPILKAEGRLNGCPDIRRIPDIPGSAFYDAKQQVLRGLREVRERRLMWCEALETLWEEFEAHFAPLTEIEIDVFNAALVRAEGPQDIEWSRTRVGYSKETATAQAIESMISKVPSTKRNDEKYHAESKSSTMKDSTSRTERKNRMPGDYPTETHSRHKSPSVSTELPLPTAYTTRVESSRRDKLAYSQASMVSSDAVASLRSMTRNLTLKSRAPSKDTHTSSKHSHKPSTQASEQHKASHVSSGCSTGVKSARDPQSRSGAPSVKIGHRVDQLKREDRSLKRERSSKTHEESASGSRRESSSSSSKKSSTMEKRR